MGDHAMPGGGHCRRQDQGEAECSLAREGETIFAEVLEKDLQTGCKGRKSRETPTPVMGNKPNRKSQMIRLPGGSSRFIVGA